MTIPKLLLTIDLDVFYDVATDCGNHMIAASKRNKKLPYDEYSEFRDFVRTIFDDRNKYLLRGYAPSTVAKEDKNRLKGIALPNKKNNVDPYGDYRKQIDDYLKHPPVSQSFYIITAVLDDDGNIACEWEIFIRVSNHSDSAISTNADGIDKKSEFIGEVFRHGDTNFTLIPIWFTISCDIKMIDGVPNKAYQLDIRKGLDEVTTESRPTLNEIKSYVSDYIEDIRNTCIHPNGNDTIHPTITPINTSTYIPDDYHRFAKFICSDFEDAIIRFNNDLMDDGDMTYDGYTWTCDHIYIADDYHVNKMHVSDNFGGSYIIYCDIDIDDYFADDDYRQSELYELCIALFEGYEWI